MANCGTNCDAYRWIRSLRPINEWESDFICTRICSNSRGSDLYLRVSKSMILEYPAVCFSIFGFERFDCKTPPPNLTKESQFQVLWFSRPIKVTASFESSLALMGDEAIFNLFINLIEGVTGVHDFSVMDYKLDSPHIFNMCFLTNLFLAVERHSQIPNKFSEWLTSSKTISKFLWRDSSELSEFLAILYNQLNCSGFKHAQKLLFNMFERNLEVKWLRSVNSAITSWNLQSEETRPVPTSLSRTSSIKGFWKAELFYPLLAMKKESSYKSAKKKLLHSLYNHQLEAVIQIHHKVVKENEQVYVIADIDNIRIDIVTLNEEKKLESPEIDEKHFPSRISLTLNPKSQRSVIGVTIGQSSQNPTIQVTEQKKKEISLKTALEFDPSTGGPKSIASAGIKFTTEKIVSTTIQAWKYEQNANNDGHGVTIDWVLYDCENGKGKVFSSKPPKKAHSWLSDHNSRANSPFSGQGGVIFAEDMYGQPICWRMCEDAIKDTLEWEIEGKIWLTYWPNKVKTSYGETRSIEFKEVVNVKFM